MRPTASALHASAVHGRLRSQLIEHLQIVPFKRSVSQLLLASLLLLAACAHCSLHAACELHPQAPAYQSVRSALHAILPHSCHDLLRRLVRALHAGLPDELFRRPQPMALDLNQRPYWGRKGTKGTTSRQRKNGTRRSFTYATLATVGPCGRFTVGFLPTYPTMRLQTIVGRLLRQAEDAGVRVAYLMMDKEFDSAEVFARLQKAQVPFLVPMQPHGKTAGAGNRRFFQAATAPGWYDYEWVIQVRKWTFLPGQAGKRVQRGKLPARVRVCVALGKWAVKLSQSQRLVYACGGLVGWSPGQVRQAYRKRFGIEAAYRQLGQCLGRTSTTNERWRLLLVGVGFLVLNMWAALHLQALGTGPLGERLLHLSHLRLQILLTSLLLVGLAEGPTDRTWATHLPGPDWLYEAAPT